jgi:hypothetical protein
MDPLKFRDQSFADTIGVAIASGDAAYVRSVDVEFTGYPSVDPAVQKMPGKKRVSIGFAVGLTVLRYRLFHSKPLCTQFLPYPNFEGFANIVQDMIRDLQ